MMPSRDFWLFKKTSPSRADTLIKRARAELRLRLTETLHHALDLSIIYITSIHYVYINDIDIAIPISYLCNHTYL